MNIRKYPRLYSLYLLVLLPSVAIYVITMEQKYSQKECEVKLLQQSYGQEKSRQQYEDEQQPFDGH